MERATKDQFERLSLRDEHAHRYELAASVARGVIVDCACGIGYGSEIVARKGRIKSYLGIDPSEEAIKYALENFSNVKTHFEIGSLEKNSCANCSVDTFLMFETLEHTESPDTALANIRRCLKQDGLLIGSVPSAEYEALCGSTYGPNPFHLQTFTKKQIVETLDKHFNYVKIFSMEFVLGSLIRQIDGENSFSAEIASSLPNNEFNINGSIVFLAGSLEAVTLALNDLGAPNKFFPSIPKVILDKDEVEPIRAAMNSMEKMIRDRDEIIANQAQVLEKRWTIMESMESMIRDRDELIASQSQTFNKRLKKTKKALLLAIKSSFFALTGKN